MSNWRQRVQFDDAGEGEFEVYFKSDDAKIHYLVPHQNRWVGMPDYWETCTLFSTRLHAEAALKVAPEPPGIDHSVAGRIGVEVEVPITLSIGSPRPVPAHSVPEGFASQVLKIVAERGSEYGTPSENHQVAADLLSTWATRRFGSPIKFSAEDVCAFNVIQKLGRLAFKTKDDGWLDVAGYTENVAQLLSSQRNN